MDVKEIVEYLTKNATEKEVSEFIKEFTIRNFKKEYLDEKEIKDIVMPVIDRQINIKTETGIKNYREGKFQEEVNARVETELRKRNPDETEDQKKLRDASQRLAQTEQVAKRTGLMNKAILYLGAKDVKIKETILSKLIGEDETETLSLIDDYISENSLLKEKITNEVLKEHNVTPKSGDKKTRFSTQEEIQRYLQNGGEYTDEIKAEFYRLQNKS
jgi:DNA integrity scanning protein DisA with diadenylate cyclase activity